MPYAVLQYLRGGSLEDFLAEGQPAHSASDVLTWLPGIASALDFIHGRGVLHRDVKPSNILFDSAGHAYLGDFGIAKVVSDSNSTTIVGSTTDGGTPGSPPYMPPEAGTGKTPSPAYDQYALGVVVYELLTHKRPHETGETVLATLVIKALHEPRPIMPLAPDVPELAAAAIRRTLSPEPDDRFGSCREFARVFERGLRADRLAPEDDTGAIAVAALASPEPVRGTRWFGPSVIAAAALLGGLGLWVWQPWIPPGVVQDDIAEVESSASDAGVVEQDAVIGSTPAQARADVSGVDATDAAASAEPAAVSPEAIEPEPPPREAPPPVPPPAPPTMVAVAYSGALPIRSP